MEVDLKKPQKYRILARKRAFEAAFFLVNRSVRTFKKLENPLDTKGQRGFRSDKENSIGCIKSKKSVNSFHEVKKSAEKNKFIDGVLADCLYAAVLW